MQGDGVKGANQFNGVRLAVAGFSSLLLLLWLFLIAPLFVKNHALIHILATATICVFTLVILTPVLIWGSWRDRILAAILTPFPVLVLLAPLFSTA